MKDKDLAKSIVNLVGGKKNIISLTHCITRLRFKLRDEDLAQTSSIKNLKGVIAVVKTGDEYQVVIGDKVADIYDLIMPMIGNGHVTSNKVVKEKPKSFGQKLVSLLSSLFLPIISVLAASGVLKGLLALFVAIHWLTPKDGTYIILYAISDAIFYFLPIIIGITSAKTFKVNEFLGVIVGASLVYPTLVKAASAKQALSFLHIPVQLMTYTSSLLPVIVAVWLMSYLVRFLKRYLPKSIQFIFVPLISLIITVPLTLIVVGPITIHISDWIADGILWLYGLAPIIAGLILAGFWQVFILLGLGYGFIPIMLNNIATKGFDPIDAMVFCTVFGQVGSALALTIKSKNEKFKELAGSASFSGVLGVTEPIIYGVTLPHIKAFVTASIGSALGGAIAGFCGSKMYGGVAPGGIFGIPMFMGKNGIDEGFIGLLISIAIAFIAAFVLTMVFVKGVNGSEKSNNTSKNSKTIKLTNKTKTVTQVIKSPLNGKTQDLKTLNDDVFSEGLMGKGVVIVPESNEILAPVNGKIKVVASTLHAIGLRTDDGVEVLIHMGIDTVKLKGKHFKVLVKKGERVKIGQKIAEADFPAIKKDGYSVACPVIVTNTSDFKDVISLKPNQKVKAGENILDIVR